MHSFSPTCEEHTLPKRKNLINFNCIILLNDMSRIRFHSKKKNPIKTENCLEPIKQFKPWGNSTPQLIHCSAWAEKSQLLGIVHKAVVKPPVRHPAVPLENYLLLDSEHFKASDHGKHFSHRKYTPATAGNTTEESSPDTDPCLAVTSALHRPFQMPVLLCSSLWDQLVGQKDQQPEDKTEGLSLPIYFPAHNT